jgi:cell division protein ZapA
MTQVTLTLNGRSYKFVCEPGEEAHFRALAAHLQSKVDSVRKQFGKVGDERILAMAALLVTDELFEARAQAAAKSNEPAAMRMSAKHPSRAARSQNKDAAAKATATAFAPPAPVVERAQHPDLNANDVPDALEGDSRAANEPTQD